MQNEGEGKPTPSFYEVKLFFWKALEEIYAL